MSGTAAILSAQRSNVRASSGHSETAVGLPEFGVQLRPRREAGIGCIAPLRSAWPAPDRETRAASWRRTGALSLDYRTGIDYGAALGARFDCSGSARRCP